MLLPLRNEYCFVRPEDGWSGKGVCHVQLAYALYAVLLAAFEITSLLGVEDCDLRGRLVVTASPAPSYQIRTQIIPEAPRFLHRFYFLRSRMNAGK
jgi:hypothetical protein